MTGAMSDYWTRMPNPAGRERGPVYTRSYETDQGILQFTLTPYWRKSERTTPGEGKVTENGWPMVKAGYSIEGMPELRPRGVRMVRVAPTLAEAKKKCERFAAGVIDGELDVHTGDLIR